MDLNGDQVRKYRSTLPKYLIGNLNQSPFEQLEDKINHYNYLELLFPNRKRTTLFLGQELSVKTSLGFKVRNCAHSGANICI